MGVGGATATAGTNEVDEVDEFKRDNHVNVPNESQRIKITLLMIMRCLICIHRNTMEIINM